MPHRSNLQFEEKPYNRCIDCVHIGVICDGPNILAMEPPRISEWLRLRKNYLQTKDPKWTNQYIADEAGVSHTTVSKVMAGIILDLKVSTLAAITRVLVNGTWGQYPCALASGEIDFEPECQHLRELLEAEKTKITYLKSQIEIKDKVIAALVEKK